MWREVGVGNLLHFYLFYALFLCSCREPQKLQNDVHTRSTQARWWNRTHPIYPGHYCNVTCPCDVSIVEVLME